MLLNASHSILKRVPVHVKGSGGARDVATIHHISEKAAESLVSALALRDAECHRMQGHVEWRRLFHLVQEVGEEDVIIR